MGRDNRSKSKPSPAFELAMVLRRELGALSREDTAVIKVMANFELLLRQLERIPEAEAWTCSSDKENSEEVGLRSRVSPFIDSSVSELCRACRIALMEVDGAARPNDACA